MALKDWKRSQTSSGFYKKKKGKLPEFIRFETTEYHGFAFEVLYHKGLDGDSKSLGYFNSKKDALTFAKKYMRSH